IGDCSKADRQCRQPSRSPCSREPFEIAVATDIIGLAWISDHCRCRREQQEELELVLLCQAVEVVCTPYLDIDHRFVPLRRQVRKQRIVQYHRSMYDALNWRALAKFP